MSLIQRDFPDGYTDALATLKSLIHDAQHRAQRTVNIALVELYWSIGKIILERQADPPWGSNVLDKVTRDLRKEFLNMKGFSRTNLYRMRAFAAAWIGEKSIVQTPSGQSSWSQNVALLSELDKQDLWQWNAQRAVQHGCSAAALEHQIHTKQRFPSPPKRSCALLGRAGSFRDKECWDPK